MSFNYPIGKAVPPPSGGGGGGGGGWGPPPGAPSGWAPPSNAWGGGSGAWAPPTGAWAAPTGAWAAGGGGGGYSGGGYPPSGPVYPPSGPGSFPSHPTQPGYLPGPYPNHPPFHGGGPSAYPPAMGGPYPPGGSVYPPHGGNVYPSGSSSYLPSPPNVFPSAPHHPGYSPYPGGEQAYEPQSVSSVAAGSTDAIEYFRAMCDKDVIPDDGRAHFLTLAGADGAIDAFELEGILNKVFLSEFKFNGFSSDMTRSLVAMRDYDISGKLGFEDFRRLWTDLAWCKRAFVMLDTNKSGAFCKNEFAKALETMGITVTPKVHQALIMRYTDKEGNVRFDDFVLCYIRLKTMMTTYQGKDPQNTGVSEFERDEFVQLAIYS